jgi:hypothetical protein
MSPDVAGPAGVGMRADGPLWFAALTQVHHVDPRPT